MLADLTPPQRTLAERMSDISEDAYCAGWLIDLEFELWQILVDGQSNRVGFALSDREINELRELSHACDGWIVYDRERAETFVPLAQWQAMFAAHAKPAGA